VTGRALVSNPHLLMLDEPTEGLSPLMVQELQAVLRAIKLGGVTLLIVEQRINFALELALLWQIFSGSGFPNQFFCDS